MRPKGAGSGLGEDRAVLWVRAVGCLWSAAVSCCSGRGRDAAAVASGSASRDRAPGWPRWAVGGQPPRPLALACRGAARQTAPGRRQAGPRSAGLRDAGSRLGCQTRLAGRQGAAGWLAGAGGAQRGAAAGGVIGRPGGMRSASGAGCLVDGDGEYVGVSVAQSERPGAVARPAGVVDILGEALVVGERCPGSPPG